MTAIFNYLWWGTTNPDKPDPVTGLSTRELYLIRKSWAKLYDQPIDNGMSLFVKLFRTEPSTQDFFATIKGQPEERFTTMPQFKAHVLGFMTSINMAVTSLHQPQVAVELMRKLGRTHRRFQVKPEHFHILTGVLADALKNDLLAKDDVIAAWTKLLSFLYQPIFEELIRED